MRVALISDLHGNLVALRAVLADIGRAGVDRIICLGDVATLGPAPDAVVATLAELGCPTVLGNHDDFLVNADLIHSYTELPVIVASVDATRASMGPSELAHLKSFLPALELDLDGTTLSLFHGSPRSAGRRAHGRGPSCRRPERGSGLGPEVARASSKMFLIDRNKSPQTAYALLAGQKTHADEAILRVQDLIETTVNRTPSVDELSKRAAMSRRTFVRRFTRATGSSPREYLQRLKVEAAKRALETGHRSVGSIAGELGYTDPVAFRKLFVRLTGLTPADYRRRYAGQDALVRGPAARSRLALTDGPPA